MKEERKGKGIQNRGNIESKGGQPLFSGVCFSATFAVVAKSFLPKPEN